MKNINTELKKENIFKIMESALQRISACDQYLEYGDLSSTGKKKLAKSLIEYSKLSDTFCEDAPQIQEIQEKYKDIIEEYELK
jgi:hypothetical protein